MREGPDARLEMRVPPEQKRFFLRAAALRGVTLTDFAIETLQEAAVRTLPAPVGDQGPASVCRCPHESACAERCAHQSSEAV